MQNRLAYNSSAYCNGYDRGYKDAQEKWEEREAHRKAALKDRRKRKKYFLEQKLYGAGLVLLSIAMLPLSDGDGTHLLLFVPLGLWLMFTREMAIVTEYYYECERRERRKE